MTSLADLTRTHSVLDREDIDHLNRLAAEWAFLSDLCFADLFLHIRAPSGRWMVVDQVRPATNQTMYTGDHVGMWATNGEDLMDHALETGGHIEAEVELSDVSGVNDLGAASAVRTP